MRLRSTLIVTSLLLTPICVFADPAQQAVPPPATATTGDQTTLRYKFVTGQDIYYTLDSSLSGTSSISGQSSSFTETADGGFDELVNSIDSAGNATITVTYSGLTLGMTVSGQSTGVPQKLVNESTKPITMVISPDGKLVKITTPVASPGDPNLVAILEQGQLAFMTILPDSPVEIGDIWHGSMPVTDAGLQIYIKSSLNGLTNQGGDNTAVISSKNYAIFSPLDGKGDQPLAMTGTQNGLATIDFDLDNGYVRSVTESKTVSMNVMPDPNDPGEGTIPMTFNLTGTTTVKLVKVVDVVYSSVDAPSATSNPPTPSTPDKP